MYQMLCWDRTLRCKRQTRTSKLFNQWAHQKQQKPPSHSCVWKTVLQATWWDVWIYLTGSPNMLIWYISRRYNPPTFHRKCVSTKWQHSMEEKSSEVIVNPLVPSAMNEVLAGKGFKCRWSMQKKTPASHLYMMLPTFQSLFLHSTNS